MIETIGLSALREIRSIKGFENAVIAGGAVRDRLLGGNFKDLDIFVPCSSPNQFKEIFGIIENKKLKTKLSFLESLKKEKLNDLKWSNFSKLSHNLNGYKTISSNYVSKIDCLYMDKLETDIVAYNLPNDENFGKQLVSEFSYHIDMVYYDGENIVTSDKFDRDAKYHEATLCKLNSIEELPGAFHKFLRLQEKYPDFIWRTNCLEIIGKEKVNKRKPKTKFVTLGELA